jgi:hypothetical protein
MTDGVLLAALPWVGVVQTHSSGIYEKLLATEPLLKALQPIAIALASVVGGVWVVFKIWHERKWQLALDIEIQPSFTQARDQTVAFIEVKPLTRERCNCGPKNGVRGMDWPTKTTKRSSHIAAASS